MNRKIFSLTCGLNDYPGVENDLRGCVNDAYDVAEKLKNKFNIYSTTLLNNELTVHNFKEIAGNYIDDAKENDFVFIHISSHGTKVLDDTNIETDGYLEAVVFYDGIFTDKQMRQLLAMKSKGVRIFIILDSCFSGGMIRAFSLFGRFGKRLPYAKPKFLMTEYVHPFAKRIRKFAYDENEEAGKKSDIIMLTGCSDTEYSYDAEFHGRPNGALTYYVCKLMDAGMNYEKLYKLLQSKLPSNIYPQHPKLYGKSELIERDLFI